MFTNDRTSVERLRAQRTLFSLWMAVAAFLVIVTMAAGIATSANAAAQAIDTLHTSAIPQVAATTKAGPTSCSSSCQPQPSSASALAA